MKKIAVPFALTIALSLLAAACGGADPTATPRPTPSPAPTATRPAATAGPTQAAATPTAAAATATRPAATVPATTAPAPTATRPPPTATPAAIATNTPAAAAGVKRGGVLKQGDRPTASKSFQIGIRDPKIGPAHDFAGRMIFQSLLQYNAYNKQALEALLADRWQLNATADVVTLRLNPNARWADGRPVTAADVKFTLDHFATPPTGFTVTGGPGTLGKSLAKVEAIDPGNVRLTLKAPDVSIFVVLADPDAAIRPSYRTLQQSATDPVGSGPFMVKDVQNDVKFVMQKNPASWLKDAQGSGLPYMDGVENIIVLNGESAFSAILTGQLDVLNNTFGTFALIGKEEQIAQRIPRSTLQIRYAGNNGVGFKNTPPFTDPRVHKAFSLALDRLAVVELSMGKGGVIDAAGFMPSVAGISDWSLPTKEILSHPGWRYLNRKTGELETDSFKLKDGVSVVYDKDPKDIEAAKQLLRDAGLDPAKGQFPKVTISAPGSFEGRAVVFASTIAKNLGITIALDVIDEAAYTSRSQQGQFQAVVHAPYTASIDPSQSLRFFTTGNSLWKHEFVVPELDALYEQQRRETDPAKRRELVWGFQRKILAGVHLVPGAHPFGANGIAREWVKDFPLPALVQQNVYSFERVWLDK